MFFDEGSAYDVVYSRPLYWIFHQKEVNQLLQLLGITIWNRTVCFLHDFVDKTKQIFTVKCVFQSTKLVQNATKGPYVRLVCVRLILTNFRRHVIGCTLHRLCHCHSIFEDFGYTEITKFDHTFFRKENILRFKISVQYLSIVNVLQSQAYLSKPI